MAHERLLFSQIVAAMPHGVAASRRCPTESQALAGTPAVVRTTRECNPDEALRPAGIPLDLDGQEHRRHGGLLDPLFAPGRI
jgi:hypothetical protein